MLRAARLFTGSDLQPDGWVHLAGERVVSVGTAAPPTAGTLVDLGEVALSPGFIDVHCHGGGGAAFTDGVQAARVAAATHHRHGTTTMMASLVTDTVERLVRQVRELGPLVAAGELAGIHLEGPWLAPEQCGAHRADLLRDPSPAEIARVLDAAAGTIRMVTLAPEVPGGIQAVRLLAAAGIIAAVGHTDATYQQALAAIAAGARVATHVFNAERGIHHREPGPVPALLETPDVVVELIADGVHVHPVMLALAARHATGRFVLITDATAAAGGGDGDYRLGPIDVMVRDGRARVAGSAEIAGSTLTLDRAVRFAVQVAGLPLPAVLASVTATPARLLGREDVGRLAPGAYADLVALDADLRVVAVMRRGVWLTR